MSGVCSFPLQFFPFHATNIKRISLFLKRCRLLFYFSSPSKWVDRNRGRRIVNGQVLVQGFSTLNEHSKHFLVQAIHPHIETLIQVLFHMHTHNFSGCIDGNSGFSNLPNTSTCRIVRNRTADFPIDRPPISWATASLKEGLGKMLCLSQKLRNPCGTASKYYAIRSLKLVKEHDWWFV